MNSKVIFSEFKDGEKFCLSIKNGDETKVYKYSSLEILKDYIDYYTWYYNALDKEIEILS